MNENNEEMPEWVKALIERVESLTEKMDKTFPESEKKKPDFSRLRSELDMNDLQLKNNKTK